MLVFPSRRWWSRRATWHRARRSLIIVVAFGSTHCARILGLTDHELAPSTAGASGEMSAPGEAGQGALAGAPNLPPSAADGGTAGEASAPQRCTARGAGSAPDPDPIPKSCRSRADGAGVDCGVERNIDCCATLAVTGGADQCLTGSEHVIEGFVLDKFEVTIGRFKQFMAAESASRIPAAGAGTHPSGANCVETDAGWDLAWNSYLPTSTAAEDWYGRCGSSTWTQSATGERDWLPASCISWFEAQAFCIWDGGYLPSWSELSYAARGGDLNSTYPWGTDSIDSAHAVYDSGGDNFARPVGSLPAGNGRWQHSDLAGNVWEWCSYNAFNGDGDCVTAPCRCNSFNRNFIHARAFGGSYGAQSWELTSTYFATGEEPTAGGFIFLKPHAGDWANLIDVGFRCARRASNAGAR